MRLEGIGGKLKYLKCIYVFIGLNKNMRSYMNQDKFFQKMKKKPALQAVLDNIQDYSDADIENLSGPHFPQWIKDQLVELRKRGGKTADDEAQRIAALMIAASKKDSK